MTLTFVVDVGELSLGQIVTLLGGQDRLADRVTTFKRVMTLAEVIAEELGGSDSLAREQVFETIANGVTDQIGHRPANMRRDSRVGNREEQWALTSATTGIRHPSTSVGHRRWGCAEVLSRATIGPARHIGRLVIDLILFRVSHLLNPALDLLGELLSCW